MTNPKTTDLTIAGETFRVDMAGDPTRPALLLAHSLGSDLTMWDGQMEAFGKHFRVIRYDSRGHGGSVGAARPLSLRRLGLDALAILDALEIDTAHVVGVSMGGAVAQWLLINAPDRIERAVLANTAARFGPPDGWNARIRATLTGGMTGNAEATIERWFGPAFIERAGERVEAVRDVLLRTDPSGYAACCAALRDMDLREALWAIGRPVLVVTGSEDPVVAEDDLALMLARIDGAAHVSLEAKHIANIEAEAAFNTAVLDFLTAKRPSIKATRGRAVPLPPPIRAGRPGRRAASARGPLRESIANPGVSAASTRGAVKAAATKSSAKAAGSKSPAKAAGSKSPAKAPASKPATRAKPAPRSRETIKGGGGAAPAEGKAKASVAARPKSAAASTKATRATASAKPSPAKAVSAGSASAKGVRGKSAPVRGASAKPVTAKPAKGAAAKGGVKTIRTAKSVAEASPAAGRTKKPRSAVGRKVAAKPAAKPAIAAAKAAKTASRATKPAAKTTKPSAKATRTPAKATKTSAKTTKPSPKATRTPAKSAKVVSSPRRAGRRR